MNKIVKYLFQGVLYAVPLVITIAVIFKIISFAGDTVKEVGLSIHPLIDPLLGLISVIILLVFIGMLGSSILFGQFFSIIDRTLEKTPFIKIVYSSVKDLLSAFVGQKKKFNHPVLVRVNDQPLVERLGFITRDSLKELHIHEGKVAVYFPLSYALTGELLIVHHSQVKAVDVNSTEYMKFIVSGGVTDID